MNGNGCNDLPTKRPAVLELKNTTAPLTTNLTTSVPAIFPSSFITTKDKTNDPSPNTGYKFNKSSKLFTFGDHKSDDDKKSEAAFTFTLEKPNLDVISNNLNIEILKTNDIKGEQILEEFNESKKNKNSEENGDNTNQGTNGEHLNQEKQQNETLNSDKEFNMKVLFNEFKELIKDFVKERVESATKIAALEKRVEALENERQSLQEIKKERASINNRVETAVVPQSIVPSVNSSINLGIFKSRAGVGTSLPNNYEYAAPTYRNAFLQSSVNGSFNRNAYHLSSSLASSPIQSISYQCHSNPTISPMNMQEFGLLPPMGNRKVVHGMESLQRGRLLDEQFMKDDYGNVEDKTIKIPTDLDANQREGNIDNARFNDLQSLIDQSIQNALKDNLTKFR